MEALKATATLGVKERNVIFLGFPDGGFDLPSYEVSLTSDALRVSFYEKESSAAIRDYCPAHGLLR